MCKITIITPVYNTEKYLDECIQSVLNQDFTDFEFILINDGSEDNSLSILRKYENKDKRIKVYSRVNQGQGVQRNFALTQAIGDYVLFLDSDDWLVEGALSEIYHKFHEENYDVIFFNAYKYFEETKLKNEYLFNECFYARFKDGVFNAKIASDIIFDSNPLCFKAYNRKFLIENNIKYSETKFIEDSEFFIKAILYAEKMSCLNAFITNYRIYNTSSTYQVHNNIDIMKKTFYICEKVFDEYYKKYPNLDLLYSFLRNRTNQFFYLFAKTQYGYKKKYYNMMRGIFRYINTKYGIKYAQNTSLQILLNLVLENCFEFYILKRFIRILKSMLPAYYI